MKAIILVGGKGTRLQPLTYYLPKPMVPVLNRPFLEYTVAYLRQYGVKDIILTLSYLPQAIADYFHDGADLGVKLSYALEPEPLGTAGAVKNAESFFDGTFIVLNGDIFSEINIADMLDFHRERRARATIALTWVDNPAAFGVVESGPEGRVRSFIEKPEPDQITSHWINAGVYILEPEVLRHVPPHTHHMFERGLFPLLLQLDEPFYGYPFRGYWLDVGTVAKYLQLNGDLLQQTVRSPLARYSCNLNKEEDVAIHPTARVNGPVFIARGARIDAGSSIDGPVCLGPGCHIGEEARIAESVVWDKVNVGPGANLNRCVVGSAVQVAARETFYRQVLTSQHARAAI